MNMKVNDHILHKVEEILANKNYPYPQNLAMAASWIIIHFKGTQVKILHTEKVSSLADYFIIANTENAMQGSAMVDAISYYLKQSGHQVRGHEGNRESDWTLLDLGDIIVHIFQESSRTVYALDTLWKDAPLITVPDEYYFDSKNAIDPLKGPTKEDGEGYF